MVFEKDYSNLPPQDAFKVTAKSTKTIPYEREIQVYTSIKTNDIVQNWITAEPGAVIDWHTHAPDMYQIHTIIEGECTWHYRDNDGETRSIVGREGEVVFLPPGAENKVEVTGDEPLVEIGTTRRSRTGRLERLSGESDTQTTPSGVVYDDMNGRFVYRDDDADII